ncbi:hypothetical protein H4S14_000770 [Agrobacterium vitis]|nr:hypothetical protein [Agrobacterium vitis]MBE1437043.1 hypothetical protein [Agrobacterium vitis]
MTNEQIREHAEELAHQIMEFVEDENPETAVHALSSVLGTLIFHNTGSQTDAAEKATVIAANISNIAIDAHRRFAEKGGEA